MKRRSFTFRLFLRLLPVLALAAALPWLLAYWMDHGWVVTTVSALILLFYGAFDGVSVVIRSTILQLATPEEMRGRVSSINGIFISSSNELGAFYAGTMAKLLGLVPAVVLGGFAVLSVAGITAWKNPTLRKLNLRDLQ